MATSNVTTRSTNNNSSNNAAQQAAARAIAKAAAQRAAGAAARNAAESPARQTNTNGNNNMGSGVLGDIRQARAERIENRQQRVANNSLGQGVVDRGGTTATDEQPVAGNNANNANSPRTEIDLQNPQQLESLPPATVQKIDAIKGQQFSSGEEIRLAFNDAGIEIFEALADAIYLTSRQPVEVDGITFEEFKNSENASAPVTDSVSGETVLAQLQSAGLSLMGSVEFGTAELEPSTQPSERWKLIEDLISDYFTEASDEFKDATPFEEYLSELVVPYLPGQIDTNTGVFGIFPETDAGFAADAWNWVAQQRAQGSIGNVRGLAVAAWLNQNGIFNKQLAASAHDLKIEIDPNATILEKLRYNFSTEVPLADQLEALGIGVQSDEALSALNWAMGSATPGWEEIQFKIAAGVLNLDQVADTELVDLSAAVSLALNGGTLTYTDNAAAVDPGALTFTPSSQDIGSTVAEDFLNRVTTSSALAGTPLTLEQSQLNVLMNAMSRPTQQGSVLPFLSPSILATLVADGDVTPHLSETGEMSLRITDPSQLLTEAIINAPGEQELSEDQIIPFIAQLLGKSVGAVDISPTQVSKILNEFNTTASENYTLDRQELANALVSGAIEAMVDEATGAITVQSNVEYLNLDEANPMVSAFMFAGVVQTPISTKFNQATKSTLGEMADQNKEIKVGFNTYRAERQGDQVILSLKTLPVSSNTENSQGSDGANGSQVQYKWIKLGTYDPSTIAVQMRTYEFDFGVQAGVQGKYDEIVKADNLEASVTANAYTRLKPFQTLQLFEPQKNNANETIGYNVLRIREYRLVSDLTYGGNFNLENGSQEANLAGGVSPYVLDIRRGYIQGSTLPQPIGLPGDNSNLVNYELDPSKATLRRGGVLTEVGLSLSFRVGGSGSIPEFDDISSAGPNMTVYMFGLHTVSNNALKMAQSLLGIQDSGTNAASNSNTGSNPAQNVSAPKRILSTAINALGQTFQHTALVLGGSPIALGLQFEHSDNNLDTAQEQAPEGRSGFETRSAADQQLPASDAPASSGMSLESLFDQFSSLNPTDVVSAELIANRREELNFPDSLNIDGSGLGPLEGPISAITSFVESNGQFIGMLNTAKASVENLWRAKSMMTSGGNNQQKLDDGKIDDVMVRAVEIALGSIMSKQVLADSDGDNPKLNNQYSLSPLSDESDAAFAARLFKNVGTELTGGALLKAFGELVEMPKPDMPDGPDRPDRPNVNLNGGIAGLLGGIGSAMAWVGAGFGAALTLGGNNSQTEGQLDNNLVQTSPYDAAAQTLADAWTLLDAVRANDGGNSIPLSPLPDKVAVEQALDNIMTSIEWIENENLQASDELHQNLHEGLLVAKEFLTEVNDDLSHGNDNFEIPIYTPIDGDEQGNETVGGNEFPVIGMNPGQTGTDDPGFVEGDVPGEVSPISVTLVDENEEDDDENPLFNPWVGQVGGVVPPSSTVTTTGPLIYS